MLTLQLYHTDVYVIPFLFLLMYHNYKMAKKKKKKNDELTSSWTIEFGQREKVSKEKVALRQWGV